MIVRPDMDIEALQSLMEDDAQSEAAEELRDLLLEAGHAGKDTSNVVDFIGYCDQAMSNAQARIDGDREIDGYMPGGHHHRNGVHIE